MQSTPTKAILITRPDHDLLNKYFHSWTKHVIDEAKRHSIKVLDLEKEKANKKTLTSYIEKINPRFIFMNGHGSDDTICGINDECLIKVNENENLLAGKIVYIRSCSVANGLGDFCIKNRVSSAFIGYTRRFTVCSIPRSAHKPLADSLARRFLEPSNLIPISILKGNTAEMAHKKSLGAMYKNFSFMLSTKASYEEKISASWLWRNMKYQELLGNKKATLS